jgi:predicted XRE-type DNA-binding protein
MEVHICFWKIAQAIVACWLGISRPRLNDLLQGQIPNSSVGAPVDIAAVACLTVQIRVAEAA